MVRCTIGFGVGGIGKVVLVLSAEEVRGRVRELTERAAQRLGVDLHDPQPLERPGPPIPAALDEFLTLIGSTGSNLSQAWFPGERVGAEILSEGQELSRRTLAIAGLPADLLGDVLFFLSSPSGAVAWVELGAGDDPPVLYLHEASTQPDAWAATFTEWLSRVIPNEDGNLPAWT